MKKLEAENLVSDSLFVSEYLTLQVALLQSYLKVLSSENSGGKVGINQLLFYSAPVDEVFLLKFEGPWHFKLL